MAKHAQNAEIRSGNTNRQTCFLRSVSTAAVCAFLFSISGTAQQPTPATSVLPRGNEQILPAERLGPYDLIQIEVAHCPELSRSFRLTQQGTLILPLLPEPLSAAGRTPEEVSQDLKQALVSHNLLVDPVVNVSVLEYRSRPVSILGAVVHPITLQATGRTTLLDAIASAGGLTPLAGSSILLSKTDASGKLTVQTIPARDLVQGVESANPRLYGGEEIRVPEGGKIFVAGNVIHPGIFPMQSDTDTTVVKAVALSAGLAPFSGKTAYIYRHEKDKSERTEVKVDLNRILEHRSPDVQLYADDILYIPTSNGKRLASRVASQIAGFGQSAGGYAVVR